MARPIAREAAMQLVFEQIFGGEGETEALVDLIDYTPGENDRQYIDMVVTGEGTFTVTCHPDGDGTWTVCEECTDLE